jgi:SAM-dependent methyltransferase
MAKNCPLCGTERIFTVRTFSVSTLRQEWLINYRFDPFLDFPRVEPMLRQHQCQVCQLVYFSPRYVGGPQFYGRLAREPWYYEANRWEFDEALRRLSAKPGIRNLLEIGCGEGFFLEKVAGIYEGLGVEINEAAAQVCRSKGLNVTTDKLETLAVSFDVIVAFEVLEHIPEPRIFLQRVSDLLAPGGFLIIAVPNPAGYLTEFDHVLLNLPPHHATWWQKETFDYVAQQLGLRTLGVADEPLRYVHYRDYYFEQIKYAFPTTGERSLGQKVKSRLRNAAFRVLANAVMPLGYQQHKQILKGQTHLIEFVKPGPST